MREPADPATLVEFAATEMSRSLRLGPPGLRRLRSQREPFLGDLMTSGFNTSPGAWFVGAGPAAVEQVIARWLAELLGMPAGTGGVFAPGGTLVNLTGTAAARRDRLCDGTSPERCSTAPTRPIPAVLHADHALGLGDDGVRCLPGTGYRLDPDPDAAQDRGRPAGRPSTVLVLANAGTTGTGAVDPPAELAGLRRDQASDCTSTARTEPRRR